MAESSPFVLGDVISSFALDVRFEVVNRNSQSSFVMLVQGFQEVDFAIGNCLTYSRVNGVDFSGKCFIPLASF